MKYFKHLFDSTAQALVAIFEENRHADKVVEHYFKNHKKWGKRDRQFFAETLYGCVRWWNQYLALSKSEDLPILDAAHRCMAVHLIVNEMPLPQWYGEFFTPEEILQRKAALSEPHLLHAIPEWLYNLGLKELGQEIWDKSLAELNIPAHVVLRANTLKNSPAQLVRILKNEEVEAEMIDEKKYPLALRLKKRGNVLKTRNFLGGGFELQDASSQLVATALAPSSGQRIVDACAGAGGKTLHMASLMQNRGKLVSLDVVQWKLDELKKRCKRAGVTIVETRLIDSDAVIKSLYSSADGLLLDVPCTGLGVFKRNPDSKWKLTPEGISEVQELQKEILQNYSVIVKPGVRMVYATCSILPSENAEQVKNFLTNNPQWTLRSEKRVFPHETGFDGFYLAVLEKQK